MSTPQAKYVTGYVKSIPASGSVVTAVVSTSAIDADGEITLPSAFAACLDDYKLNPVLLFGHPWMFDEIAPPELCIGHAVRFALTPETDDGGGSLELDFDYAADVNPTAERVLGLVRRKSLRAYSVGYFMREWVTRTSPQEQIDALPRFAREALLSGAAKLVHTRVKLFETSQVFVGSNGEALAVMRSLRRSKESTMTEDSWRMCGSRSLPMDQDDSWDKQAAEDSLGEDWDAWEKAHVLCYGPRDKKGSYHLPFARKADGELKAVKGGVQACAGAHGIDAVKGCPDDLRGDGKDLIAHYYAKFDPPATPPWEKEKSMPANAQSKTPTAGAAQGKRHPAKFDVVARLHAAAETVADWDFWFDGCNGDDDDPPEPEICNGVIAILQDICVDLKALAGIDVAADAEAPVAPVVPRSIRAGRGGRSLAKAIATMHATAQGKEGRKFSDASMDCIKGVIDGLTEHAKGLHKAGDDAAAHAKELSDLIADIDASEEDDEGDILDDTGKALRRQFDAALK